MDKNTTQKLHQVLIKLERLEEVRNLNIKRIEDLNIKLSNLIQRLNNKEVI